MNHPVLWITYIRGSLRSLIPDDIYILGPLGRVLLVFVLVRLHWDLYVMKAEVGTTILRLLCQDHHTMIAFWCFHHFLIGTSSLGKLSIVDICGTYSLVKQCVPRIS